MSLINDALKKAQKQRTGENTPLSAMPSVGGESAARIAKRAKPVGFNALLIRLGLGAGAVLVLGIGGYFVLRSKPEPSAVSGQPSVAPKSESPDPKAQTPEPVVAPPKTPEPRPKTPDPAATSAFVLPVVTPPPPAPATQNTENREPRTEARPGPSSVVRPPSAQAAPSSVLRPPPSEPAKPAPSVKLEPRAITYIEALRIAGIRASATDAKVLMNDRVYRVGDIVEHEMGLKLTGITANSLTFEDEHGGRYTRQF